MSWGSLCFLGKSSNLWALVCGKHRGYLEILQKGQCSGLCPKQAHRFHLQVAKNTVLFTHTLPSLLYYFLSFPGPEILGNGSLQNLPVLLDFYPPHPRADTGALCQDPPLEHGALWPPHSWTAPHERSGGNSNNPCHTHAQALESLGCVWGEGSGLVVKGFGSFWSLEKFRKLCEKLQNLWTLLQHVILKQASGNLYVSCCLVLSFPVQRDEASRDPFHTIQYKSAKNCRISLRELYQLEKILE